MLDFDINAACKLANLSENKIVYSRYHCEFSYPEYEGLLLTFYDLAVPPEEATYAQYQYHFTIDCKSFHLLFVVEEDLFSIGREGDTPIVLTEDIMMLDEVAREEIIFDVEGAQADLLFFKLFIG